nr:MAG TPA: hypothetical protein [Caudoviricetes sp.]
MYRVNVASAFVVLTIVPCVISPDHPVDFTYAKNG